MFDSNRCRVDADGDAWRARWRRSRCGCSSFPDLGLLRQQVLVAARLGQGKREAGPGLKGPTRPNVMLS